MGKPAENTVFLEDFLGLVNNVDDRAIPPGAGQIQINCCCIRMGELEVRWGLRQLTFDSEP